MLSTTIPALRCPSCQGSLSTHSKTQARTEVQACFEITSGSLECRECHEQYPILGGVAILVQDVRGFLLGHVKGIAQAVPDSEIPKPFLRDYRRAKAQIQPEHIEEDLEAERVVSLYLMNHYLTANSEAESPSWWRPDSGAHSPLIDSLIRSYWDEGPLAKISGWVETLSRDRPIDRTIEVGCGVGGLARMLQGRVRSYLGVDSSFASVRLARRLNLGIPDPNGIRIPADLLQGPVSRPIQVPIASGFDGSIDFVVGEIESVPVSRCEFDLSLALNAIDMLPEPEILSRLQNELLKPGGWAIQSCPYIWHPGVAQDLRDKVPESIKDSAAAAEWLYAQAGFTIEEKIDHLPWLFFKHLRQLEIYSVHLFRARKS